MEYCTYLTIYRGTKMPMFYIGRSNVKSVQNGYRGSVASKLYKTIWLDELVTNPQLFETKILTTHFTQKEAADKEEYFHKKYQVHKNPLYINQATSAGTFHADIKGKKNPFYGSARNGELNPMYGKTHNEQTRQKMSANGKGKHSQPKTEEFKQTLRNMYSGKTIEERFGIEEAARLRALMKRPKTDEHKQKLSELAKSRPQIACPHCGKQSIAPNFKRWHGDNCKLFTKKISNEL
jgi:hypothetical protein